MKTKTYTVFGFHSDNDQRFATSVSAADPEQAEVIAYKDTDSPETLCICGVIEGDHKCVDTDGQVRRA
jgi:hypothetical protein